MQSHQQRQHDSLRRVQDFLDVNAATVGAAADPVARKQLDASVAALTGLGTDQGAADQRMAGQLNRERAIAAELKTQHLAPIAAFARAHLRGSPDYAALTRASSSLNRATLVRAARSMASAAAPYAAQLALGGFPADTITQLTAAADALEAAHLERANTKVGRVGITTGIAQQLQSGRNAVAKLHAAISRQFATDPTFLAAWDAARRVTAKPGAVRKVAGTPVVTAGTPAAAAAVSL